MRLNILVFIICILQISESYGQTNLPEQNVTLDPVRSPVDYQFSLSGNFGELRSTHFHTGIDIKPNRSGDLPIMSVSDGFVSRIAINAGGYGNVLYIEHPEVGLTSVYAHLDRFNDHISSAIYNYQLSNETFKADIKFEPYLIPISRGEMIGIMGNTGYSFGKHLHFELRETATENPINPYHYGIYPKDDIAPTISGLAFHGLDGDYHKIYDRRVSLASQVGDTISIITPITLPQANIGLAIQVFDKADNSYSKNGIYGLKAFVDDALIYDYKIDTLAFGQNRQIIGFFDHAVRKKEDKTFSLCYRTPGNDLDFLIHNGNGLIDLAQDESKRIIIEVSDYFANKRYVKFIIQGTLPDSTYRIPSPHMRISQGVKTEIDTAGAQIVFDEKSLFRSMFCKIIVDTAGSENVYVIGEELEPIKTPIFLAIKPKLDEGKDPSKAVILYRNGVSYGGKWKDGYLTTKMRDFGRYTIAYDTKAPEIRSLSFTAAAHKRSSFAFTIKDNYGTRGDDVVEISYKVWIDGSFVVCPFRQLNSTLTIPIETVGPGEHTLKIEARDHSRNFSYFDAVFRR